MTGTARGTCSLLPQRAVPPWILRDEQELTRWIQEKEEVRQTEQHARTRIRRHEQRGMPGMWEAGLLGQACATLRTSQIKFSKPYLLQGEFPTAQHTPPTISCPLPEMLLTCRSSLSFLRPAAPLLGPSFMDPSLLLPAPGLACGSPLPTILPPSLASRTHWVLYIVGTQRGIANPKREEVS